MSENLPTVITSDGLQPQTPAQLQKQLLDGVAATNPGYTANLPGSLIEDISSTDVGALVQIDQMRVETVNSLTPRGANAFVLKQLGEMLGVEIGVGSNTSVLVQFTATDALGNPLPGFVIGRGFTVSDGSHQYVVQTGGSTRSDGVTPQLYALASEAGTWAVPPNTVVNLVTSQPSNITITVTNPQAGLPGTNSETETSYRSRVIQANLAASTGMLSFLRTLLGEVEGVQQRLISAIPQPGNKWLVIVGGGDIYQVAYAIYSAVFDVSSLVGSTILITDITSDSPAKVTTDLTHLLIEGDSCEISDVNPSSFDGTFTVMEVLSPTEFTIGVPYPARTAMSASWSAGENEYTFAAPHGVTVGSKVTLTGFDPVGFNASSAVVTFVTSTTFTVASSDPGTFVSPGNLQAGVANFDATALTYVSGGVLEPNSRNVAASIVDYPDTYVVPYVNPPRQIVTMTVTWNTDSPNFVSSAAIAQQATPALVDYINSVPVGKPLNRFEMDRVFQRATASILPNEFLSRLVFAVSIDGEGVSPSSGTGLYFGDPQSYFGSEESDISVVQG